MANLAAPAIDFSGASGQPTSGAALVTGASMAPPAVIIYTGGILSSPAAAQIAPEEAQTVGYPIG